MPLGFIVYFGAIVAGLWSLSRPRMGIYYLILVFPAQTLRAQAGDYPAGAQLIDLVLLAVVIGMVINNYELNLREMPMRWLLILMPLWWYISLWRGSLLWSIGMPLSIGDPRFSDWKCIAEMQVLAFIAFAVIRRREEIIMAVKLMCLGAFFVAFDFFQVMNQRDLSHYTYQVRYSGLLGYAGVNGLGAFAASMAVLATGIYLGKRPKQLNCYLAVVMAGCIYIVLFSFSRGAYLALAAGALYIAIAKRSTWLIIVLSLGIIAANAIPGVSDRISGTYSSSDGGEAALDSSAQARIIVWQDAIELIKSHPLLGTGFDSYRYMHRVGSLMDTHNYYLKVWLEEGMAGLLLFFIVLLAMIKQGNDLYRSSPDPFFATMGLAFAACMVAASVSNVFGDRWTYQQIVAYWWIFLAMVGRARALQPETVKEKSPSREPMLILEPGAEFGYR
jgi:O-antigen ligase